MGIETAGFARRWTRKLKGRSTLAELYGRTCSVCGVQADAASGKCRVCHRQVIQVEHDPVPDDVMRPVDPERAALQKAFYARLERQRKEREEAAAERERKAEVPRLPGESVSGDPPKRDWNQVIDQYGHPRHLS